MLELLAEGAQAMEFETVLTMARYHMYIKAFPTPTALREMKCDAAGITKRLHAKAQRQGWFSQPYKGRNRLFLG